MKRRNAKMAEKKETTVEDDKELPARKTTTKSRKRARKSPQKMRKLKIKG
jgi:hypothetical protein